MLLRASRDGLRERAIGEGAQLAAAWSARAWILLTTAAAGVTDRAACAQGLLQELITSAAHDVSAWGDLRLGGYPWMSKTARHD